MEFDLIKENINSLLLSYAIKSILLKKKVLILIRKSYLKELILNFFHFLTQDTFDIEILLLSKEKYNREKEKYHNYMVLEKREILNNVDNAIDPNNLTIEKRIVKDFFTSNLIESLNNLKNEILQFYTLSKNIAEFISQNSEKSKLTSEIIFQHLKGATTMEISREMFHLLLEITQNYFDVDFVFNYK